MSQPTPMKLKPRPDFDWKKPPGKHRRRTRRPLSRPLLRQIALCCALALLTVCYAGPWQSGATEVLAIKRELPVYCVEREDSVITVSFDASWGGS